MKGKIKCLDLFKGTAPSNRCCHCPSPSGEGARRADEVEREKKGEAKMPKELKDERIPPLRDDDAMKN